MYTITTKMHTILSIVCLVAIFAVADLSAQQTSDNQQQTIQSVLDSQGLLQLDKLSDGTYSLDGKKMYTKDDGTPLFLNAEHEDNERWDDSFGEAYVFGPIQNLKKHDGNIYLVGDFNAVSDGNNYSPASNLAMWDGESFTTYPGVFDGNEINDIAFIGEYMIVAGNFSKITVGEDEIEANNIAKWDGEQWSALGEGLNNNAFALHAVGSTLYVGGTFTQVNGGINAPYIARWSSSSGSWNSLSGGALTGAVRTITDDGNNIYIGGDFSGGDLNRVAGWDGSGWFSMDGGVNSRVHVLYLHENKLYAGGIFTETAGGETLRRLAVWDFDANDGEEQWEEVAGSSPDNTVMSIVADGDDLIIGGQFQNIGITEALRVARLSEGSWSSLGSGMNNNVKGLAIGNDGKLYAGGRFSQADGSPVSRFAVWEENQWNRVGSDDINLPTLSFVYDFAVYQGDLYVGGLISEIDGVEMNGIARWDGSTWHDLDGGLTVGGQQAGQIASLKVYDGNLYVGGIFDTAGSLTQPANSIARWNGSEWSRLGAGLTGPGNSYAYHLTVINGDLYAGGFFAEAAGITVNNLARWDGTDWFDVGNGVDDAGSGNGYIQMIYNEGDNLYVGGSFDFVGGTDDPVDAANIAVYSLTGESWSALGEGFNNDVFDIVHYNGMLIAGGAFEESGTEPVNGLAVWDETEEMWVEFAGGIQSQTTSTPAVTSFEIVEETLYVTGFFRTIGEQELQVNSIAAYKDDEWSALGQGLLIFNNPGISFKLREKDGRLWTGGQFLGTGNKSANHIGNWDLQLGVSTEEPVAERPARHQLNQNYPNPFNPVTTINFDLSDAAAVQITVYDMLGRKVASVAEGQFNSGSHTVSFDASNLSSGVYLYRLQAVTAQGETFMQTRKMTLIK